MPDEEQQWVELDDVWNDRRDRKWETFSWLTVRALLSSVNDIIGKKAPRLVNDMRGAWVARQEQVDGNGRWDDEFVVHATGARSLLLLGDPGEQDFSQYAVVPVLASQGDADFMVVMSDVIYPSGDVNDYVDGFYVPYRHLDMPIFGMPGNHDWYDSLNGFMWNFCGAEALPPDAYDSGGYRLGERIARRLWKRASPPKRDVLEAFRNERAPKGEEWQPLQPGPYYAIETADLLIVCVDSGIAGDIDREQAEWLVRVSEKSTKPKLMLVGRPLVDKMCHKPGPFPAIEGLPVDGADGTPFHTVDDVARHEPYRYVAAIGGDTHNFQRYDVTLRQDGGERPFHYVVSGGGGAYMSETHTIPTAESLKFGEHSGAAAQEIELDAFSCYPTRVDSLRYFSRLVVPRLRRLVFRVAWAILGFALAAAAALALGADDELKTALAAGAAIVGLLALGTFFRPQRYTRGEDPGAVGRSGTYAVAFLLGAVCALSVWWLARDDYGRHVAVVAAVAAFVFAITLLMRTTGWWRSRAGAIAANGLMLVGGIAGLTVLLVGNDADWVKVAVMALAVIALPLAAIMLVDRLRVVLPKYYKAVVFALLCILVALGVLFLPGDWWRAVAAAVTAAALTVLTVALGHLNFLNGFSFLYRTGIGDGALDEAEARKVIDWRDRDDAQRPGGRTRRIANMVYPGTKNPRGPVHRLISEIFDRDEAPLYKNFLRVDVDGDELTITCFHARGNETGPQDVTHEDPLVIDLSVHRSAAPRAGS